MAKHHRGRITVIEDGFSEVDRNQNLATTLI